MKFFKPQKSKAFRNPGQFKKIAEDYNRHLEKLQDVLPERVLELAKPSGMENGLVVRVDHDRKRRLLRLVLRCGHLQMGYYNLILTYEDAEISPEHDVVLAKVARTTKTQRLHQRDLAYHELDSFEGGRIEHRFLFDSFEPGRPDWVWFSIRCRSLRWCREQKRSRRLPPSEDRYPAGPQV